MSLGVVTPPLLTHKFFRGPEYPRAFSLVMMLSTLASAFAPGILGWMYDWTGSYRAALALCMGLCLLFLLLCGAMFLQYKKLTHDRLKGEEL